jgi:hypothetical protein
MPSVMRRPLGAIITDPRTVLGGTPHAVGLGVTSLIVRLQFGLGADLVLLAAIFVVLGSG